MSLKNAEMLLRLEASLKAEHSDSNLTSDDVKQIALDVFQEEFAKLSDNK